MAGWVAPAAAAAAWSAILAARGLGLGPAAGWALTFAGAALGVLAAALATRRARDGPALLRAAGLLPEPIAGGVDGEGRTREAILAAMAERPASGSPPGDPPGTGDAADPPSPPRAAVALASGLASVALLAAGLSGVRSTAPARDALLSVERALHAEVVLIGDARDGEYGWSAPAVVVLAEPPGAPVLRLRAPAWLQGRDRAPPLVVGDRVRVTGSVRPPPDDDGFGEYLRARGIGIVIRANVVERLGPSANPLIRAANAVRGALQRSAAAILPEPRGGLFLGLTVGDVSRLDPGVEEDFRATGLGHLVAVSGSNVAMFLTPILAAAAALRLGRRTTFAVGVVSLGFFALLTRAEPSVLRACAMAGLTLLAVLLGRARSTWSILGTAVLALLLWDPGLATAIGFQLSVAATIGIVAFAGTLAERIPGPRVIALAAAATLGAQAAVTPLLLFRFHVVPTVTLPANLLAFPAVGPAMLLGLVACGAWLVSPALGNALGGVASMPLGYLIGVADRMASAPLPSLTSQGDVGSFLLGLAAVAWLVLRLAGRRRVRASSAPGPSAPPRRRAVLLVAVLVPVLVWTRAVPAGPPGSLEVIFFDVGQGDAALVRSPAGASVLIDAGPERDVAAAKLARAGVHRLDVVIATHAHADHVEGFPAVFARFAVGLVLEPGCGGESPSYRDFTRAVRDEGLDVRHPRAGETLRAGDLRIEVLAPLACHVGTASDANNDSVVVRISVGDASVLFPGDAEEPAQEELLEAGTHLLEADVLKVPHHGGGTSLEEFLVAARSEVAVVSVGEDNEYGHPVPWVTATLRAAGAEVVRTDRTGDVVVRWEGGRPSVESARAA